MELALSLGDSSKPFPSLHKSRKMSSGNIDLGFCMGLAAFSTSSSNNNEDEEDDERRASSDPPPLQQIDLLPASSVAVSAPVPVRVHQANTQLQWLTSSLMSVSPTNSFSEGVVKSCQEMSSSRVLKRKPLAVVEEAEDDQSSPNSTSSSFQHLDFSIYRKCFGSGGNNNSKRPWEYLKDTTRIGDGDTGETNNRGGGGSDDEDNGLTRKKLRLSKDQSAFLEESFKEHNTLTPKQKIALAKELNLRPRQVEVWFQNRRARTKLKQTEVDCEYLKRCCETLTEENRRLQKELQELRALKTSQPFFMQLPATTLTMCPACERVTSTSATPTATASGTTTSNKQPPHPSPTANTTATNTTNSTVGGTALALAPPPPPNNNNSNTKNNSSSSSSSSKLIPFLAAHAQAAGQRTPGSRSSDCCLIDKL